MKKILCICSLLIFLCGCSFDWILKQNSSADASSVSSEQPISKSDDYQNSNTNDISITPTSDDENLQVENMQKYTDFVKFAGKTGLFSLTFDKDNLSELHDEMIWGIASVAITHLYSTVDTLAFYKYDDNEKLYVASSDIDPLLLQWFDFDLLHAGSPNYDKTVDGYYLGEGIGNFGYYINIVSTEIKGSELHFKLENLNSFSGDLINASEVIFIKTDDNEYKCFSCTVI